MKNIKQFLENWIVKDGKSKAIDRISIVSIVFISLLVLIFYLITI